MPFLIIEGALQIIILIFYTLLLFYLCKSSWINIKALNANILYIRQQGLVMQFLPSLSLKRNMLKCHCLLSVLYIVGIISGVTMHDTVSANLYAQES